MKTSSYLYTACCLAVLFCLVSLTSCYTYETYKTSLVPEYTMRYRNWTSRQVMNKYGAPDRTLSVGNHSEVLVYEKFNTIGLAVEGLAVSKQKRCYTEFYFDENDKCYNVKTSDYNKNIQ